MNAPAVMTSADSLRDGAPARVVCDRAILPGLVRAVDLMVMAVAAVASQALFVEPALSVNKDVFCYVFFGAIYIALALQADLYALYATVRPVSRMDDILIAHVTAMLFLFAVIFSLEIQRDFNFPRILSFVGISFFGIGLARVAVARAVRAMARRDMFRSRFVVLGVGDQSAHLIERVDADEPMLMKLAGVFDPDLGPGATPGAREFHGRPVLGGLDALLARARAGEIDNVVVALPWNADAKVLDAIAALKELPLNVYLCSDLIGFKLNFTPILGNFHALPLFEVMQRPISGWSSALKSIEDKVIAAALLLLLSPLLLAVAAAIRLDSPGPVFFRQPRLGFNNRRFEIYKFRSMHHRDAPETVVRQASKRDPRITRVGRFIRATSIDELPQLINVLEGSMSLVGPRPHALSHNEEYGQRIRGYFARHRVKPGITGWAQVNGFRGETDTLDKMERRIDYDIYYTENWSLFFDIKILFMTAFVVLFQRNAY